MSRTRRPRSTEHYVDDEKFYRAMAEYKEQCIENEKQGKDRPRLSNYIGECIWKIANHIATMPKFSNYPFRDEMVMHACENAVRYAHNFDHIKYKKPFAYFTRVVMFAFYRKIAEEKKILYIKYKVMESAMADESLFETDNIDDDFSVMMPGRNENREAYIRDYEEKLQNKHKKTDLAKKTSLQKAFDEE